MTVCEREMQCGTAAHLPSVALGKGPKRAVCSKCESIDLQNKAFLSGPWKRYNFITNLLILAAKNTNNTAKSELSQLKTR